jgi:hypothetical protein
MSIYSMGNNVNIGFVTRVYCTIDRHEFISIPAELLLLVVKTICNANSIHSVRNTE